MLGRARSPGRSPTAPARGPRRGRHLPLGRPSLRAPPRRRARPRRPASACSTPATPPTCSTSCARSAGWRQTGRRFPRKSTLLDIYSRTVNAQRPLREVLAEAFPWCERHADDLARLFVEYVARKRGLGVLDLDDLLLYWRALAQRRGRRAPTLSGVVRPRAGRRVPGRQRAAGRHRPRRCAASDPDADRRRRRPAGRCTASASASARAHPRLPRALPRRARWSRWSATTARPSRCSTSPTPSRRRPSAAYRKAPARRAPGRPRARAGATASTRPPRPTEVCERVLDARERGAALREQAVLMRAGARLATCSSSSSPAATSRTSSTAGCATWRPRTSRTSSPCCAWPTTRPIELALVPLAAAARRRRAGDARGRVLDGARARRRRAARRARALARRARRAARARRAGRRTPSSRRWAPPSASAAAGARAERAARRAGTARRGALPRRRRAPARPRRARRRPPAQSPTCARFVADLVLDPPASSSDLAGPPQPRRGLARAQHGALGQGPRVATSVHVLALYDGNFPSDMSRGRSRGDRRGAPPALRRAHPRPARPAPLRAAALLPPPARRRRRRTATASRRASSPTTSSRCAVAPTAPGSTSTRPAR